MISAIRSSPRCCAGRNFCDRRVVVAQQFFFARTARRSRGDVAGICAAAEQVRPRLKTYRTELIGADPRLIQVLGDRYREACGRAPF